MTTLVAVRKHDEIAIAADSLTTFGDTRLSAQFDRSYDKIVQHRGNFVGLCGSAAHQLVFQNMLAKNPDLDFSNKAAIFDTFSKLHPILKEQHFLNPKEEEDDPYESTQVTALIANENGIFGVYSMREVFEYTQYWAIGSGREFALGAMYAQYSRLKSAAAVARAGACARDEPTTREAAGARPPCIPDWVGSDGAHTTARLCNCKFAVLQFVLDFSLKRC